MSERTREAIVADINAAKDRLDAVEAELVALDTGRPVHADMVEAQIERMRKAAESKPNPLAPKRVNPITGEEAK